MGGFAGFISFEEDVREKQSVGEAMARVLTPRGPDAGGYWADATAMLVHRRLIVIDPVHGKQPMCSENGENILVYNGELYNTEELRRELTGCGHTFIGHSDTEVVLHAFCQWGADCLTRFNGIYALAIWNQKKKELFLARDRLGVKPLFYSIIKEGVVFGSEIKALLRHPSVRPQISQDGLRSILLLGPARAPGDGIFRNIQEVLAGHYAYFSIDGFRQLPYWGLVAKEHPDNLEQTIEHTRWLVEDATRRQLISDVPLCTFLSGGLGSSILTMLAVQAYQPLHTWSVQYADNVKYFIPDNFQPNLDDDCISIMIKQTTHHPVTLDNAALCAALLPATDARDMPGMADIDSSLLLFCSQVKKDFTVCLSGVCAEELFGGAPWYHNDEILFSDTFPWSPSLTLRLSLLRQGAIEDAEEFVQTKYRNTCDAALTGESPREARIREMFLLNLQWFMATLLEHKDRMSMYSGLEVRVPFCDHRIVEYAYNMPWDFKNTEEKGILWKAFEHALPKEIIKRNISPYPKPFSPLYTELTASYVRQIFRDKNSIAASLFNQDSINRLMEDPNSLSEPWFGQFMQAPQIFAYIIQIDRWFKKYKIELV